jgi:hypothetical protein
MDCPSCKNQYYKKCAKIMMRIHSHLFLGKNILYGLRLIKFGRDWCSKTGPSSVKQDLKNRTQRSLEDK